MLMIDLVNSYKNTFLVLAHICKAFKIYSHRHFKVTSLNFRNTISYQVMMFKRTNGKFNTSHSPNLFSPKASSIHYMLTSNVPFFSFNNPTISGLYEAINLNFLVIFSASLFCSSSIGLNCSRGINITLTVRPHRTKNTVFRHNWTTFLRFFRS